MTHSQFLLYIFSVYNGDTLTHFTVSKEWQHNFCVGRLENIVSITFLAVSPHRVSAYGVFILWDAQFGYGFRKAGHSKTMPDNTSVAVETTTKNDSTGASYNDHDNNVVFDC